jgi:hypothetical protein
MTFENRVEAAKQYFKERKGVNIDEFLDARQAKLDRFYSQPVGPTPDCLTGTDVREMVNTPILARLLHPVKAHHLSDCRDCKKEYSSYAQDSFYFMKDRS